MSRKVIIGALVLFALIAGIVLYPKISLFLNSRKKTFNKDVVTFYIDKNMNASSLAKKLKQEGIINNEKSFVKVADYKAISEENIALGKYLIEPNTEYRTILNGFKLNTAGNGNAEVEVNVTFNNCRDLFQLAGKVSANLIMDSIDLVNYLSDEEVVKKYGFTKEEFPAMFIPNTYKMFYDTDKKAFVERMAKEFKNFWTTERLSKLKKIGLESPSAAVTLASIVYSEQGNHKEEWPIIAGLYLNRIKQGIKLQSDPTFKFCWGDQLDGVQRLLNVHRDIVCVYNTYQIYGLPPGPICIPPSETVDAVLNRTENNYIFMMAKPDYSGLHDFSVEYSTHQKYASIYQKWLANELINQ